MQYFNDAYICVIHSFMHHLRMCKYVYPTYMLKCYRVMLEEKKIQTTCQSLLLLQELKPTYQAGNNNSRT